MRLHDPDGARFRIPDAKTDAGVHEVQMSPELVEEFVSHFDRLRRAGRRTDPDAYAFPNTRGWRIARQRVARIVGEAATRASARVSGRGLPPLPHTTPRTLRRTYISIALLANRFDVLWVMGQVGHADSKMTLDVYVQLQQRVKREHGRAFDTLVRRAREQLYGTTSGLPEPAPEPNLGHESGHEDTLRESDAGQDAPSGKQESQDLQADRGMARPGLEPGTPRFSGSRGRAILPAERLQMSGFQVAASWRDAVTLAGLPRVWDSMEGLKSQKKCGRADAAKVERPTGEVDEVEDQPGDRATTKEPPHGFGLCRTSLRLPSQVGVKQGRFVRAG